MKKILILFTAAMLVVSGSLQAQESPKPHSDLYNQLGVTVGPVSGFGTLVYGTIGFFSAIGAGLGHTALDMNLYGHYGIHYYYQVTQWCQVGVKASVECAEYKHYSDTLRTTLTSVDRDALLTVMPSVQFTYLNRPWVRLYSGVDLGVGYTWSNRTEYAKADTEDGHSGNQFLFAFNVTPFGLTVGKRFYGLFELNVGYDAFFKAGIGARF